MAVDNPLITNVFKAFDGCYMQVGGHFNFSAFAQRHKTLITTSSRVYND